MWGAGSKHPKLLFKSVPSFCHCQKHLPLRIHQLSNFNSCCFKNLLLQLIIISFTLVNGVTFPLGDVTALYFTILINYIKVNGINCHTLTLRPSQVCCGSVPCDVSGKHLRCMSALPGRINSSPTLPRCPYGTQPGF